MGRLYLLHPVSVHFPIAILLTGFVFHGFVYFKKSGEFLTKVSPLFLWIGAVAAWISVGLGLLAQKTAPHNPAAWEVMYEHKELGLWTAGLFTFVAIWKIFFPKRAELLFTLAWAIAAGFLIATAYHGGQLVYDFGMGVGTPD